MQTLIRTSAATLLVVAAYSASGHAQTAPDNDTAADTAIESTGPSSKDPSPSADADADAEGSASAGAGTGSPSPEPGASGDSSSAGSDTEGSSKVYEPNDSAEKNSN